MIKVFMATVTDNGFIRSHSRLRLVSWHLRRALCLVTSIWVESLEGDLFL